VTVDPQTLGARCDLCPLGKDRQPVFASPPVGDNKLKLIIVGEAPGRQEQRLGVPFVGPSGKLVDRTLADVGAPELRSYSYLTNSAFCRGDSDKDNDSAAVCCAPRLYNELAALPPDVPILALGKAAAKSVLNVKSILMARGFVWTAKEIDEGALKAARRLADKAEMVGAPRKVKARKRWEAKTKQLPQVDPRLARLKADSLEGRAKLAGRVVFPSIHPAFVLRADTWKPVFQIDLRRVVRFVRGELTMKDLPITGPYVVVSSVTAIRRELRKLGPIVAVDIETTGIDPHTAKILCIGISDGVNTVIIGPWCPEGSERPKTGFAQALTDQLEWREQVWMHNGFGYDQIAMRRDGIVFGDNLEDTLQAHHTFASHLPQRLDQVVSEFDDSMPWKVKFGRRGAEEKGLAPHKMPPKELYMYNAGDCWRTARAARNMRHDLAREASVYEHDKKLALICQNMQITGVLMDVEKRDFLAKKMKKRASALKGNMRRLVKNQSFSPSKPNDIRRAIFRRFKSPVFAVTPTGMASTASTTLEALRVNDTRAGKLAGMVLDWRGVMKIKSTYLDAITVGGDNRVRVSWKPWGTVSGRWASRLQSTPRPAVNKETGKVVLESRVREVYVPRPGYELVYFDLSQAEMRFAAYLSGDPKFIEEMKQKDPYLARARALFPRKDQLETLAEVDEKGKVKHPIGKELRQIAKTASLAANYLATPENVFGKMKSDGFDVQINAVIAAFDMIHITYRAYFRYVERNLERVRREGFMRTPIIGRKRILGFFPKPADVANTPVQSGIADVMNERLIEMDAQKPRDTYLVLQVHDAGIFECKKGRASDQMWDLIGETWKKPIVIPKSSVCDEERSFVMPIERKRVDTCWAQL
jgi:uracil-DNA glycosylase family 4